jgi:Ser/Thr protein kinase RdoA (MazF antagonist)
VSRPPVSHTELSSRVLAEVRGVDGIGRYLARHYGIEVSSVSALDGPWRRVHRVDRRDGPPWVVRVFTEHRSTERVHGDAEILRLVEHHNFPAERCAHAVPITSYEGQTLLVTTFVEGSPGATTMEHEAALGDLLGRLHTVPVTEGAASRPGGALHHDPEREGRPHEDIVAATAFLDDASERIDDEYRPLLQKLRRLAASADGCEGLPDALLHPDMVGPNVLVTPNGDRVAIDWTGAGTGPRLSSFAFLLWGAGLVPGGDDAIIEAIVQSYRHHVQLSVEELDRLEGAMLVRPLFFSAWGLWRAIMKGAAPRPFDTSIELSKSIARGRSAQAGAARC